ncbi:MAG: Holliday junction resolvase-like protein [Anaerolineales bacterium]
MTVQPETLLTVTLVAALVVGMIYLYLALRFERWKREFERRIRDDAVKKSQAVTLGKVTEHLIPYLPDFDYNPRDVRFLGSPIDLIVFDGLDEGDLGDIVFIEVKTGDSDLNSRERRVREAVQGKRVRWLELRAFEPQIPAG